MRIEDYRSRLDVSRIDMESANPPEGQEFIPSIRTHHVLKYSALCQSRIGWQETACRMKPWELDESSRLAVSRHAARSTALHDTATMLRLREVFHSEAGIASQYDKGYYRDVIGDSDDTAKIYLLRSYALYRNFLMSLNDPDRLFSLSAESDAMCRACIGDGSGTGEHCISPSFPWDNDQILLRYIRNSSFAIEENGVMHVQAQAFFDPDFGKLVGVGNNFS